MEICVNWFIIGGIPVLESCQVRRTFKLFRNFGIMRGDILSLTKSKDFRNLVMISCVGMSEIPSLTRTWVNNACAWKESLDQTKEKWKVHMIVLHKNMKLNNLYFIVWFDIKPLLGRYCSETYALDIQSAICQTLY